MKKRLSALTGNINILSRKGGDPEISGLAYDSRRVRPGDLFFATDGIHTDGHRYIGSAVAAGAAAVVCSRMPEETSDDATYLVTENPRTAMSSVAAAFWDNPSEKLVTIGVTGTDGKTTTVYLIDQLLCLLGRKSGFISTAACKTDTVIGKNPYRQSTPEPPEIHMMLSGMLDSGCTHAVVEATSHGLSDRNNRLGDVYFDAAVLTNITHEHLEFHGTFEQYRSDKTNLFRMLARSSNPGACGVINLDDPSAVYVTQNCPRPVISCSITNPEADYFAFDIRQSSSGSSFTVREKSTGRDFPASISLPGMFNIENSLEAAAAAACVTGEDMQRICGLLPELSAVKGRMRLVDGGQPFTLLIDYAHTPGSFEKLFPDLRRQTNGRLIAVFGSAGERDMEKRPIQGRIASMYSDIIILADEDPRNDDPMEILTDIAAGALEIEGPYKKETGRNLFLIPDRREAFRKAFETARKGDTVVLLGKGHESSIIYADGPVDWDEETAAAEILESMFGRATSC